MKGCGMSKAFTLVELLVVIAIMGILGAIATGGYRAMVRGMEERGVMQNVNSFVRAAYQRAQIDRQPTMIVFRNEVVREKTENESEIVVGKAIAIRRSGRISFVRGSELFDEFADLGSEFATQEEGEAEGSQQSESANADKMLRELYLMDNLGSGACEYSYVNQQVRRARIPDEPRIGGFCYVLANPNGISWRAGMSYGFEFQRIELPKNYIFGGGSGSGSTVQEVGTMTFRLENDAVVVGGATIEVSALRQKGTTMSAVKIATTQSPEEGL